MTSGCVVSPALARAEFVRLYREAVQDIFYGRIPVPSVDWVAHMIGVAATYSLDLRERVRCGLDFVIKCRRLGSDVAATMVLRDEVALAQEQEL